jgi:hypothetical protein
MQTVLNQVLSLLETLGLFSLEESDPAYDRYDSKAGDLSVFSGQESSALFRLMDSDSEAA